MKRSLRGLALISFAILFYLVSGELQSYLWTWHIGVAVPWGPIALLIGIAGMILVFKDQGSPSA